MTAPVRGLASEELPSSKALLAAVTGAMRGDRARLDGLIDKTRADLQTRAIDELRRALRGEAPGRRNKKKPAGPNKKSRVRGAKPKPAPPLPPLRTRSVRLRLPSGRTTRVATASGLVSHADLEAMRVRIQLDGRKTREGVAHNGRAVDELVRSVRALEKQVEKLGSGFDLALLRQVLSTVNGLERGLAKVEQNVSKTMTDVADVTRGLSASQTSLQEGLGKRVRAATVEKLNGAVASMQTAAFGAKGSLLATNNLLLAGNQLLASFASELGGALGLSSKTVAWASPALGLAFSQLTLGRRQNLRHVTGIVTRFARTPMSVEKGIRSSSEFGSDSWFAEVSLRNYIAPALWPAFRRRTDVVVNTTLSGAGEPAVVEADVRDGRLYIAVRGPLRAPLASGMKVTWSVDTQEVARGG